MATKLKIPEESFRLGCGRYVQKEGVLSTIADEVRLLGASTPYVIGGKTAFSLTKQTIDKSFEIAAMHASYYEYTKFCCKEICDEIMQTEAFKNSDIVIGVGGGNVMDAAKYCAVKSKKPLINVPTSSATCAAYTPLSVCYNQRGQTIGTAHHNIEVNCVLADMDILCKQPIRLLLSGVYDSIAKIYELKQRLIGVTVEDTDIGLYTSYYLSNFLTDLLEKNLEKACQDVIAQKNTKTVYDVVYACIAMTGVVSGFARGSNQTAIAHKIYESLRALFPETVYSFLHGELVAIGLIAQIAYNGEGDADAFRAQMKKLGMPTSLTELGIANTKENGTLLYEKLLASSAMAGTNEEEHLRLKDALKLIK